MIKIRIQLIFINGIKKKRLNSEKQKPIREQSHIRLSQIGMHTNHRVITNEPQKQTT